MNTMYSLKYLDYMISQLNLTSWISWDCPLHTKSDQHPKTKFIFHGLWPKPQKW